MPSFNAEFVNTEPLLLVINGEPRLSFLEKTSPSRVETLIKQNRAEIMLFLS